MSNQTNTEEDGVAPHFMSIAEVPPSDFVATRMGRKKQDDDIIALVDAVKRLQDGGDDEDQHRDIWHTAYFGSKDHADVFLKWLDERAFCAVSCCHLDSGGWRVSAFNYGFTNLVDLIKWYSIVHEQVCKANGQYVEIRVRVMCDDGHAIE
ncbi:hypothetical protein [Paraburkholderia aromaticivorans]|uniref:hypothetical protein n=1 Tax=Paraburkholderia aromaticivorans TaxID=2026199 RepID=UPI00145616B0|nr:hypothetical protein [Paraburkholderia aromaticivorans]